MSIAPEKIRHVASADNWVAIFAIPEPPFYRVLPLMGWALLTGDGVQTMLGYVAGAETHAYPVTDTLDGSVFVAYVDLPLAGSAATHGLGDLAESLWNQPLRRAYELGLRLHHELYPDEYVEDDAE